MIGPIVSKWEQKWRLTSYRNNACLLWYHCQKNQEQKTSNSFISLLRMPDNPLVAKVEFTTVARCTWLHANCSGCRTGRINSYSLSTLLLLHSCRKYSAQLFLWDTDLYPWHCQTHPINTGPVNRICAVAKRLGWLNDTRNHKGYSFHLQICIPTHDRSCLQWIGLGNIYFLHLHNVICNQRSAATQKNLEASKQLIRECKLHKTHFNQVNKFENDFEFESKIEIDFYCFLCKCKWGN